MFNDQFQLEIQRARDEIKRADAATPRPNAPEARPRPRWSMPDAATLAQARMGRDEIQQAERYSR